MFQTPIFIPSRSRANRLSKGVLSKLPHDIRKYTSLVVPQNQVQEYVDEVTRLGYWTTVFGSDSEGIAATRKEIGTIAKNHSCKTFIMLDDDLTDWATRISPDTHKLRQSTPDDMIEMFTWVESTLVDYAHVSISPRGNNMIRNSQGVWIGEKPLTQENVRTIRFLAYQTEPFLSVEHGRVPVMEDFDVNLQLLEKGYKNIQSFWWTQDQRQTALPGGCSDYRDLQLHESGARKLQELHPQFVTLREKQNKSKVTYNKEFTKRIEVVVQWKKAYESSVKKT